MDIRIKSVYAVRGPEDGYKVLVDDFLPASMNEKLAGVDLWMRMLTPSEGLKNMFEPIHDNWDKFIPAYFIELEKEKGYLIEILTDLARSDGLTLFYSTSDPEHNIAVAVRDYILAREAGKLRKAA
ncbi:MAG TPA: DUF488 family protein [Nitrospirota bacterium]|jgi:uncharacterized protein YeaO (DUF488 family)